MCTSFQCTRTDFLCYNILLGQFQIKLLLKFILHCGKGPQNFASNITLYPCERSRQNHPETYLSFEVFTALIPLPFARLPSALLHFQTTYCIPYVEFGSLTITLTNKDVLILSKVAVAVMLKTRLSFWTSFLKYIAVLSNWLCNTCVLVRGFIHYLFYKEASSQTL